MKTIAVLIGLVGVAAAATLPNTSARADGFQSWVSSAGSGSTCSRAQPCDSFLNAHAATFSGGQINCIDNGNFGFVVITKSITIDCSATFSNVTAGVSGVGVAVNGDGIIVTLRGLSVQGYGQQAIGIDLINAAELHVENCRIVGFSGLAPGHGIKVEPGNGITTKLHVLDTVITDNGLANSGGGIIVQPTGSGSARVMIERSHIETNTYGIFANGTGSTGVIAVHVRDSVIANNAINGISAFTQAGKSTTSIVVDHSSSNLNGGSGILAQGVGGYITLKDSTVISNGTGLTVANGGNIFSYQNNALTGNVADGAPTAVLTLK